MTKVPRVLRVHVVRQVIVVSKALRAHVVLKVLRVHVARQVMVASRVLKVP